MSFNPNLPASHSPLDSAEMRGQLNGLKTLIDGTPGITAVQVDAVNTISPGSPATVNAQIVGTTLHLAFSLPQGNDGAQGLPGGNGNDGQTGPQGAQGDVNFPQLNAAIADALAAAAAAAAANSSAKSNSVATLDGPLADPDSEALRVKMNELLTALRRT